jgi:hypothetical protein
MTFETLQRETYRRLFATQKLRRRCDAPGFSDDAENLE